MFVVVVGVIIAQSVNAITAHICHPYFWALRFLRWEQNSRRKRHCRHRQPSPPPPPPPPADSLSWRYRQLVIEKAPTCWAEHQLPSAVVVRRRRRTLSLAPPALPCLALPCLALLGADPPRPDAAHSSGQHSASTSTTHPLLSKVSAHFASTQRSDDRPRKAP